MHFAMTILTRTLRVLPVVPAERRSSAVGHMDLVVPEAGIYSQKCDRRPILTSLHQVSPITL